MSGHLTKPLAKFHYHTSCLYYLFEFQCVTSRVKSSQSQWHSIHENWWLASSLPFYLGLMPSLFSVIPDSSSLHADIANYFKLSGRQFQFQLNLVFSTDLGVENRVALSALNSYGCHLRRNLNSILPWLQRIHAEFTLVKTEVCSVYVF